MGNITSNALRKLRGRAELRILMVGLDAAGKTTILYKLQLGKVVTTIPTIGFNVETMEHSGKHVVSFTTWDVGGRDKIRPLWRHYYANTDAIVFVVDCNDRERVEEVRDQLHKMLEEEELMDAPLLVFANKQDLPNVMKTPELVDKLGLHAMRRRYWLVQESCAVKGTGLFEGLEWLSETMKRIKKDREKAIFVSHNHVEDLSVEARSAAIMDTLRNKSLGKGGPESMADTESTADTEAFDEDRRVELHGSGA